MGCDPAEAPSHAILETAVFPRNTVRIVATWNESPTFNAAVAPHSGPLTTVHGESDSRRGRTSEPLAVAWLASGYALKRGHSAPTVSAPSAMRNSGSPGQASLAPPCSSSSSSSRRNTNAGSCCSPRRSASSSSRSVASSGKRSASAAEKLRPLAPPRIRRTTRVAWARRRANVRRLYPGSRPSLKRPRRESAPRRRREHLA